jgi:hypothetical protein
MIAVRVAFIFVVGVAVGSAVGCAGSAEPVTPGTTPTGSSAGSTGVATRAATDVSDPARVWVEAVGAECAVPAGWRADPLDRSRPGSASQVWIAPSGSTAYGVIAVRHLLMPLASDGQILGEFFREMKASEGAADLLEEQRDPALAGGIGGVRFVARGGRYLMRGNIVSRGTRAWVVYAGTLLADPVRDDELRQAERARERTVVEPARGRHG